MREREFGWLSVVRLGLIQAALGALVSITNSTLNRVMVVEFALPAMVPGALVALHHAMQLLRPRMGHGADGGRRHTPWIVGGMATLALGGIGAGVSTAMLGSHFAVGMALAIVAYTLIGAGVSAAGTSLLVLMARRVPGERRAAAATIVWMMMIAGIILTSVVSGKLLSPFSLGRLMAVTGGVSVVGLLVTLAAIAGLEGRGHAGLVSVPAAHAGHAGHAAHEAPKPPFAQALKQAWADPDARHFTIFVFVSMLAYSAQDLILEPFAGVRFGFSPGESTKLNGVQHGGVLAGMLLVAVVTTLFKGRALASLKGWVVGGCLASAIALMGLVTAGLGDMSWPLRQNVFVLGLGNGAFSIAAIGAMMALASAGRQSPDGKGSGEGVRMGLWGASQSIAFGAGGFVGTILADLAKALVGSSRLAYASVFALEVVGFVFAAWLGLGIAFAKPTQKPAAAAPLELEIAPSAAQ